MRELTQLSRATALLRARDEEADRQGAAADGLGRALREAEDRAAAERTAHAAAEARWGEQRAQLTVAQHEVAAQLASTGWVRTRVRELEPPPRRDTRESPKALALTG